MSQASDLLEYMQQGNTITSKEAYEKFGITQLGARLSDLEEQGYKFDKENWITVKDHNGDDTQVKEYRLIPEDEPTFFSDYETKMPQHRREVEGK